MDNLADADSLTGVEKEDEVEGEAAGDNMNGNQSIGECFKREKRKERTFYRTVISFLPDMDDMDIGDEIDDEEMMEDGDMDEEYEDDEEEGEYEDEEYEDEFVEDGDEYVGGPDLGAGAYNQNIMDGIQAKSYTEQPRRRRSRKRRKRRNRNQGNDGMGEDGRTIGDEEEEYDDDYDNEGTVPAFPYGL